MENNMSKHLIIAGFIGALMLPSLAVAQGGPAAGAATGAVGGAIVGGPVGAVVGGAAGAIVGGIADADRPRFRTYVQSRHVKPYKWNGEVVVGATLPSRDIEYYEVPAEYKATKYRYTVVNGRTVLVDPGSHRIVEVIE